MSVSAPEHLTVFDRVFAEFFGTRPGSSAVLVTERERTWTLRGGGEAGREGQAGEEAVARVGASAFERLAHRDFAGLTPEEVAEMRKLIATMAWRPSLVRRRRFRFSATGPRPDLRRTVREAAGGDLFDLAWSQPRMRRRPLLLIADVSGSMERYSEMLLYFAHAIRGRLGRLEAFVFSTHLTRITRQLYKRDPGEALAEVGATVDDWSGGTKIGDAVRTFNREWSRRVTHGGPIAVMVSDGWDRGDPEVLTEEMARLRRTVHRLVWLNPLAGRPGFAPDTRGMQAALPYIDDFLPAANLTDLTSVVELLESIPARR